MSAITSAGMNSSGSSRCCAWSGYFWFLTSTGACPSAAPGHPVPLNRRDRSLLQMRGPRRCRCRDLVLVCRDHRKPVRSRRQRREPRKVTGRCSCCGLLHWYERWPDGSTGPYYERCVEHVQQPDELETTTLARLRDHESRLQRYADYAAQRATQYEREAKAEGGRQAARALRQRATIRGGLLRCASCMPTGWSMQGLLHTLPLRHH
jgi:hypothetical protein